jgi:hypothetical protein
MKTCSFCRFIAQAREGCPFISTMIRFILFSLAGLVVPVMLSASQADAPREAAATLRETGPDYSAGKLVGTMLSSSLSGAVFENASGEQKFYRKGVTFSDGSRILAVYSESIVVRTPEGSSVEYLVTRGTAGRSGAAPANRPAVETPSPSYSGSQDRRNEGEMVKTLRGKRRHGRNSEQDE